MREALNTVLCRALPAGAEVRGEPREIESEVARLFQAGSEAWPDLEVVPAAFAEYVGRSLSGAVEVSGLAHLPAADLFLACACATGDPRAARVFVREFSRDIARAVASVGLDADSAEDVSQNVLFRLLVPSEGVTRIGEYRGLGPLRGWIRAIAVRAGLDHATSAKRATPVETSLLDRVASSQESPELQALKERCRPDLRRALRAGFAALTARERHLVRQHFAHGVGLDQLARAYGVHKVTVFRWIARARERLLETARERLGRSTKDQGTLESLIAILASQVTIPLGVERRSEKKP